MHSDGAYLSQSAVQGGCRVNTRERNLHKLMHSAQGIGSEDRWRENDSLEEKKQKSISYAFGDMAGGICFALTILVFLLTA